MPAYCIIPENMPIEARIDRQALKLEVYGGKAGPLNYIAKQLPDIPQPRWICTEPGESNGEFARRVIEWREDADRVLIRSSRGLRNDTDSEFYGNEGRFSTSQADFTTEFGDLKVSVPNEGYGLAQTVLERFIKESRGNGAAMAAVYSPNKYHCTLVQHPGNPDQLIATVGTQSPFGSVEHDTYICDRSGDIREFARKLYRFTPYDLFEGLKTVLPWADQITTLPAFDPNWTIQLELGLDPPELYQARLFRERATADFSIIDPVKDIGGGEVLVFGTTPKEGREFEGVIRGGRPIGSIGSSPDKMIYDERLRNILFYSDQIHPGGVLVLHRADGMLTHEDSSVLRQAGMVILSDKSIFGPKIYGLVSEGRPFRIISNGREVSIQPA